MSEPFYCRPVEDCPILEQMKRAGDDAATWQHVGGCFPCLRNMGRLYLWLKQQVEQADPLADRPVPDLNRGAN